MFEIITPGVFSIVSSRKRHNAATSQSGVIAADLEITTKAQHVYFATLLLKILLPNNSTTSKSEVIASDLEIITKAQRVYFATHLLKVLLPGTMRLPLSHR